MQVVLFMTCILSIFEFAPVVVVLVVVCGSIQACSGGSSACVGRAVMLHIVLHYLFTGHIIL